MKGEKREEWDRSTDKKKMGGSLHAILRDYRLASQTHSSSGSIFFILQPFWWHIAIKKLSPFVFFFFCA